MYSYCGFRFNVKETKLMEVGRRISRDDICINGEANKTRCNFETS